MLLIQSQKKSKDSEQKMIGVLIGVVRRKSNGVFPNDTASHTDINLVVVSVYGLIYYNMFSACQHQLCFRVVSSEHDSIWHCHCARVV